MDYIIQMRVTRTVDKHVCKVCGKDAYLCGVGYEATDQELANRLHDELQQAQTWEQLLKVPVASKVSDAVFEATVQEQRGSGPCEHEQFYQCASCFSELLSFVMGNTSGFDVIKWLEMSPLTYAVFCTRKIAVPDQCLMAVAKDHDPLLVLAALRDEDVPHLKTS